jgi:hypothetical protein
VEEANGITIRPWQAPDRPAVQVLLKLFSEEAEVTASDAPAYVAERDGVVVGMVTLCVYTTLTGVKAYLDHLVVPLNREGSGSVTRLWSTRSTGREMRMPRALTSLRAQ